MININGIAHIALSVKNLDKSKTFYKYKRKEYIKKQMMMLNLKVKRNLNQAELTN